MHQYVNWDKIDVWAKNRGIKMFEPRLLVHLTFVPCVADPSPLLALGTSSLSSSARRFTIHGKLWFYGNTSYADPTRSVV